MTSIATSKKIMMIIFITAINIVVLLMGAVAYSAPLTVTASIDSEKREVSVNCLVPSSAAGQKVTLLLLNPKTNSNDQGYILGDINDGNISSIGNVAKQGIIDPKGACSFKFILNSNAVGGWYQVKIGVNGISMTESERSAVFYYASQTEILNAEVAINEANISNLDLDRYKLPLGLNLNDDYLKVSSEVNEKLLLQRDEKPGKKFSNLSEIQSAYKIAVGWALMNNEVSSKMGYVISTYGTELLPEFMSVYTNSPEVTDQIHILFEGLRNSFVNKKIEDLNELKLTFKKAIAIAKVNYSGREEMTGVLTLYNDVLGLDLTGYYQQLGSDNILVNKALFAKNFTTIADIKSAFDTRIVEIQAERTKKQPSGGGGGGVGSTPTVIPIVNIQPVAKVYFSDIDSVEWAKESIENLASKKVIEGIGDKLFKPNEMVTREQFVKMLVVGFGILDLNETTDFTDVKKDEWYYPYIASLQKLGIATGMEDGTFGINKEITRQDMAVFAIRVAQKANLILPNVETAVKFNDESEIDNYALESVKIMQQAGIITGAGNNSFYPKQKATRAESAKIIYKLLKLAGK